MINIELEYFLRIGLIISLLMICYEDFNERKVLWIWFPLVFILVLGQSVRMLPAVELLIYVVINIFIYCIILLSLFVYLLTRHGNKKFELSAYMGVGDLLFFITLSFTFSPFNFVLFNIVTFLIALMGSLFHKKRNQTIPLAGWQAICLLFTFVCIWIFAIDPFNNFWLQLWS